MKKAMQNTAHGLQRILLTLQKYEIEMKYIVRRKHIGRHCITCKSERNRRYGRRRIRSTSSHGLQKLLKQ